MKWPLSIRSFVYPSICNALFSKLAHDRSLIFCMQLGVNKRKKVTNPNFWKIQPFFLRWPKMDQETGFWMDTQIMAKTTCPQIWGKQRQKWADQLRRQSIYKGLWGSKWTFFNIYLIRFDKLPGIVLHIIRSKAEKFPLLARACRPGRSKFGHICSPKMPFLRYLKFESSDFDETSRKCSWYEKS